MSALQPGSGGGLPAPSGPYPVGRLARHWVDPDRDELPPAPAGSKRELMVFVWYPAAREPAAQPAPYLPAGWDGVGSFWGFEAGGVRSHAYQDAPVAADRGQYPVLVFSPAGFPPLLLAAVLGEIASHGYVVVGLNHT